MTTASARAADGLRAARPPEELSGRGALGLILAGALLWSLLQVEWEGGVLRAGGLDVLARTALGLARPDLSPEVLRMVAGAAWTTLLYAALGMSVALALAVPMGVIASGVLLRPGRARRILVAGSRALLAGLRSVHELVWAWLFVAALGLSPVAAVLALAIPYSGILGRIYADLLNDVAAGPLDALRTSGADEARVLAYGRLPMAAPDMLAYTFYRFECAIRSSAILGFVGVGGIGLQIQLALADLRYGVVGTLLLALVLLIAAVEGWSALARRGMTGGGSAPGRAHLPISLAAGATLAAGAWAWIALGTAGAGLGADPLRRVAQLLGALLGLPTELSPTGGAERFLSAARWGDMAVLAYDTLAMSVLAIGIAAAGALLTVMAGAPPTEDGTVGPAGRALRWAAFGAVRGGWILARAVPELVWALLLVLVMPPGVLAGALALGVHNLGIVGKLCSEVVEDLDPGPARALRSAGAGRLQVLAYAVLPQALPQFLTYVLYRWEVVIRTTIVVGFVSAGGLGREFRLAMSFFHFTDVTMILATYFALVLGVDAASSGLRRLAAGPPQGMPS